MEDSPGAPEIYSTNIDDRGIIPLHLTTAVRRSGKYALTYLAEIDYFRLPTLYPTLLYHWALKLLWKLFIINIEK